MNESSRFLQQVAQLSGGPLAKDRAARASGSRAAPLPPAPPELRHLQQLERHREPSVPGARSLRNSLQEPDRPRTQTRVGLLVRMCSQCSAGKSKNASSSSWLRVSASMAFGYFAPYSARNFSISFSAASRPGALMISFNVAFALSCRRFGSLFSTFTDAVHPGALRARLGPHVAHRRPEPEGAVTHGECGCPHAAPAQFPEHCAPALGRLAVASAPRCRPGARP